MHVYVLCIVLLLLGIHGCDGVLQSDSTNDTSLQLSSCFVQQQQCNSNSDCVHRLVYLHESCINQTATLDQSCPVSCRMAVLNLYQLEFGRTLLHTDISCLGDVKATLIRCLLLPSSRPQHCTLAKQACEFDNTCVDYKGRYLQYCEAQIARGECSAECARRLETVTQSDKGAALKDCECSKEGDFLCEHFKGSMLTPCLSRMNELDRLVPLRVEDTTVDKPQAVLHNGLHEIHEYNSAVSGFQSVVRDGMGVITAMVYAYLVV